MKRTPLKRTGLRNRFPPKVRQVWLDWYECMLCGLTGADCLHHIVPPTNKFYQDGKHNESIYNSSPLHNYTFQPMNEQQELLKREYARSASCHIGNDGMLNSTEVTSELLNKTRNALDDMGYEPNDVDKKFLEVYAEVYNVGKAVCRPPSL